MSDLKVTQLTKTVLRGFLNDDQHWYHKTVALPKSKIQWLLDNERFEDDDICGVIATENDTLVGLVYLVPDILKATNQKVFWISYWWIAEKYVGNVLATYIFSEAMNAVNNQAIVKSYAEFATNFYSKMPFNVIYERPRYTLFLSLDPDILIAKFKFLNYFKPLLRAADWGVSKTLKLLNNVTITSSTKTLRYEYINTLDQPTWTFIEPLCKTDLSLKTRAYIDWQISPLQFSKSPVAQTPYTALETGISPNIAIYNVKVILDHKIIGFLSFITNYNECNVKYFLVADETHYHNCVAALLQNFNTLKSKYIFTDDTKLANHINKHFKTTFTHSTVKKALAHNAVNLNEESPVLFDRDGHFY